jgi:cytochrome c-type biogenesis protein CcmH/NrfF
VATRGRWRRAALWAAVAVVAGLALAIGAGAFSAGHTKPPSLYQRTLAVAGQYRCPVCASESAAVSDAAEAVEIRSLIEGWLKKGDSQAQIRNFLVSDYGTSILEKPPATGLNAVVWALPGAAAALGVAGLGFAFVRWRRVGTQVASGQVASGPPAERAGHPVPVLAAGATEEASPAPLMSSASTTAELTAPAPRLTPALLSKSAPVQERLFDPGDGEEAATAPGPDEPAAVRPLHRRPLHPRPLYRRPLYRRPLYGRPLYRRVAPVLGAVLIVVAGALWLIDRSTSQRLPGGTVTGGVTGVDVELQQAASLASSNPAAALAIYDAVLVNDPDQPVALSGEGWIYAEAGYVTKGEGLLQKAESDDPSYDPPHLYRGLVLLEDQRQPAAAIKELKWYLAHGPDPTMAKTARTALAQAEARL